MAIAYLVATLVVVSIVGLVVQVLLGVKNLVTREKRP